MTFKGNLSFLYTIVPFLSLIENKYSLILSLLFGRSVHSIKIHNSTIKFSRNKFSVITYLLGCLSFAYASSINPKKILTLSFDDNNHFEIPLNDLSVENCNLLEILYFGNKYGANFFTKDLTQNQVREKSFKILTVDDKKIIMNNDGISFFVDSIHPGNTILETYIQKIHHVDSKINWEGKVVVDVGAECGDTPLYFAHLGANVFAFEALKKHYEFMLKNLELNEELSKKITPINAAIGKDGPLNFFISASNEQSGTLGASFLYNNQNSSFKRETVSGFQLSSARKKFNIGHIDLLKMDCKGCEFLLTDDDLDDIDMVKIEYSIHDKNHKSENLLKLLKQNGFKTMIYRTSDTVRISNVTNGTIFGSRI